MTGGWPALENAVLAVWKASSPPVQLQNGSIEGDSVAPSQQPDCPFEVLIEPPNCELLHAETS